jgi:isoquinoline 1-oxidoreductase subunit beta
MSTEMDSTRRDFLKAGAQLSAGLVLGFAMPVAGRWGAIADAAAADAAAADAAAADAAAAGAATPRALNAFVRIAPDESVTLIMNKSEMGQGVYTGLVQLLCEELEYDPARVRLETAPVDAAYNHPAFGSQVTGGSSSIPSSWEQLRLTGAAARTMLIEAAAAKWAVPADKCRAEKGAVHGPGRRKATYGQLAQSASMLAAPDPKSIVLKPKSEFKIVGRPVKRVEAAEKINGSGKFGLDVRVPGMLRAVVARPPTFGGTPKSVDDAAARAVRGVVNVVAIGSGVAVVARNTHAARKGRDALMIDWVAGPGASLDTERQRSDYLKLAQNPSPAVARSQGDVAAALSRAAIRLDAYYELPYLSHASMEPLNCVAHWRAERCDVWTGTQMQTIDRAAAAHVAGLAPEQVFIHTTLLGGGFGRRANLNSDFVREAVELSKKLAAPVQVIWTREDDMRGGYYRPMWTDRIQAGLDEQGMPVAWQHTIVGQSLLTGTVFEKLAVRDGVDALSVEGAADMPYAVPNLRVDLHTTRDPVPVQSWRSVGHSHTAFVVETFIDECAHAAGKDPFEYRRALLSGKHARRRGVLDLLEQKVKELPPAAAGHGRGIAVHESFNSVVGEMAEVSLRDGVPRVHRVIVVIDCGFAINPQLVEAQMESAVTFGLSAALYGEITFKDGKPLQSNFDGYPVVRMNDAPQVEAHIVPSDAAPTGAGEPATPPIAPAVANAIFALTQKRVRRLPMIRAGQSTV